MKDPQQVELEVVICTYNNAALLAQTLQTIAAQEVDPDLKWCVTVIDNNSTDETAQVVAEFQAQGRIPELRRLFEVRQGLTYARLHAFANSRAAWITFIDDDNLLKPDFVMKAAEFARAHPNCGAFGAKVELDENPTAPLPVDWQPVTVSTQSWGDAPFRLATQGLVHLIGAGLTLQLAAVSASGWLEQQTLIGRTGERLSGGEDIELVLMVRKAGYELWYNPACMLRHIVPLRRATPEYLKRITRGNATAMTMISGLYPNREPFALWVIGKVGKLAVLSAQFVALAVRPKLPLRSRLRRDMLSAEIQGRVDGLVAAVTMPRAARVSWFGRAK